MQTRDWRQRNQWIADLLKRRTGDDVETWNARIRQASLESEPSLRGWLAEHGVTGYPHMMLVMEARKTYVSLLSPRRTFAAVQATTRRRVDLGLRLNHLQPGGRLERASSMGSTMDTERTRRRTCSSAIHP